MLKVSGISLPLDASDSCRGGSPIKTGPVIAAVARELGLGVQDIDYARVVRRSIDARKKSNVHFSLSVAVRLRDNRREDKLAEGGVASWKPYTALEIPDASGATACSPLVVGTGPAGLFAALYLARAGLRPVVVERGARVDRRAEDVSLLNNKGLLNPQSNIQFGEGGAGTFSDGKLTTNTNNQMSEHVLNWFVEAGAPSEILWDAQPHIGSDRLPAVVATMREEIISLGGEVLFDTQLTDVVFCNARLHEAVCTLVSGEVKRIPCTHLVLACGHSARDTFELLEGAGVHLEQKPFSVGVRIEHAQAAINQAQWGGFAHHPALGAASYKLAVHDCAGRSVYTFCMCPGGEVVCAASEEGGIATNGMSPFARDGRFANAALLSNVGPSDCSDTGPLAGMRFQQEIERRAFLLSQEAGGAPYQIPAQTVASFLSNVVDKTLPASSCARGVVPCNLRHILPAPICESLASALPRLNRKLSGFAAPDALLLGPETRSSSPVRISRNDALQSWLVGTSREEGCGIYPAGEGAGYAGGIMSAACDGLRVARALVLEILGAKQAQDTRP